MTLEEFENYKFGINTMILYDDEWFEVVGVDFEDNTIQCQGLSHWVDYWDVEEIRQSK